MNEHLWWYVARAGGLVSWVLVAAAVLWGLALSGRLSRRPRPAWVLDLHRFLGVLAVVFAGVHLLGLVADSYVHFGPAELFVPLASSWRPGPVAWGVVALYLLLAIELTSLAMRRLPRRLWRGIHLTSYGLFVIGTVHLLTAGTDAHNPIVQWAVLVASFAVVNLTVVRAFSRPERRGPARDRARETTSAGGAALPRPSDASTRAPRVGANERAYPGSMTPNRERADINDQRESQLRPEPIDAAEPIESTERNDPADPIDRIEPAEPMERIEPFDAIDKIESADHNDHFDGAAAATVSPR